MAFTYQIDCQSIQPGQRRAVQEISLGERLFESDLETEQIRPLVLAQSRPSSFVIVQCHRRREVDRQTQGQVLQRRGGGIVDGRIHPDLVGGEVEDLQHRAAFDILHVVGPQFHGHGLGRVEV